MGVVATEGVGPAQNPLQRLFNLRDGEAPTALLSVLFFFLILFGYFLVRPVREAMGVNGGMWELRALFYATMVVMLVANPVIGILVAMFNRRVFLPIIYSFFALNLLGFAALLRFAPESIGENTGRVFFVWVSVYNFTVISFFWALMADGFTLERAKRLFPFVAVGGTLGAIAGSGLVARIGESVPPEGLMTMSAGCLLMAAGCAVGLSILFPPSEKTARRRVSEAEHRNPLAGFMQVARSPYLLGVCGYILLMAIVSTFLYFAQARVVSAAEEETGGRVAAFASIDFWTQVATLTLQLSLTGKLIRIVGVGITLIVLPVAGGIGCLLLGIGENVGMTAAQSLVAITVLQAGFRAGRYAIARPARETLFTVVSPDEKYKAKTLIDTFVYRAGDAAGAGIDGLLAAAGVGLFGLMLMVAPTAAIWAGLGLYLGYKQGRLAASEDEGPGGAEPSEAKGVPA